ncbi:MAG: AraC family transcriptional regulator [Pseudomonadota bacterium]
MAIPVLDPDTGQIRPERGQMDSPALLNLPLPLLTALLCGVIAVLIGQLRTLIPRSRVLFVILFVLCASEALLVGLRFGYGMTALTPVQRFLPLYLGPLMYLGFAALTQSTDRFARSAIAHLGAPIVAFAYFQVVLDDMSAIDGLISASYLMYLSALFLLWRKGGDALIHAPVGLTRSLSNWILRGIGLLAFVLFMDTAIALDFIVNRGANAAVLISYGTVPLVFILVAMLVALPSLLAPPATAPRPDPAMDRQDGVIERRLNTLLTQDHLFLDPDLTVQRLAKRLHLPARSVSAAVNRTCGMNVSQYVNQHRLQHAADLLANGNESVTKIAEQSGFMTRSNFYREFRRVHGQSPSEYRKSRTNGIVEV